MPLDSLLHLVETLRQRIAEHGAELRQSEAQTRYALIDPLLRELGWDTSSPNVVVPEYKSGHGSADYALRKDGKTVMIIEAKKLGTSLSDVVVQALGYCQIEGVRHLALTDGRTWELFATHHEGDIEEKRIITIDLTADAPAEVCRKAFALWRPNADQGTLLIGEDPIVPASNAYTISGEGREEPSPPQSKLPVPPDDWQPLDTLQVKMGAPPPKEMRMPDGTIVNLPYWNRVLTEPIGWLIATNRLNSGNLPFQPAGAKRYLIASTPEHPGGNQMHNGHKVHEWHVETSHSAPDCVWHAVLAIQHAGQDPSAFKVRFS